jgi:hypothetical protein
MSFDGVLPVGGSSKASSSTEPAVHRYSMVLMAANKHRLFQAHTGAKQVLSFHFLGLGVFHARIRFILSQWKKTLNG